MPSERDALYGPEPGASEAWADMATADSHSGVPVEGPDWDALEREWLDATPPAGHPLIHGIFQRLPDRLAPFLAAAPREASEPTDIERLRRIEAAALAFVADWQGMMDEGDDKYIDALRAALAPREAKTPGERE